MLVKTKHFGEIDLEESKIITFDHGIMGFEEYRKFTILFDKGEGNEAVISWFQSLDEPGFAIPVISPFHIKADYDPVVEDELLISLGNITGDNLVILLTLTVPPDLTKMTANLKAPIIINSDTRKGCQIIVENTDYEIKYNVFEAVQKLKQEKGEK